MSYFDIAIIAIVALGALVGLWKGFFKTFISFFGWTASFLIAFFLTKHVANALLDIGKVRHFVLGTEGGWSLFQWISGKLPSLEESGGFVEILFSPLIETSVKAGVDPLLGVPLLLSNGMFSAVVCLALFLIIRMFMLIFTLFANAMTKGKFKGMLNRFLGFLFGAVKGTATVCFIMVFLTFVMGLSFMAPVREQLDKSVIAQPVYKQVVKLSDKYLAGNEATLNKLLHHLGLEEKDNAPAYCGTYTGQSTHIPLYGTYTVTVADATYTLALGEETNAYTLKTTIGENETSEMGTYTVEGNSVTLTSNAEGATPRTGTFGGGELTLDGITYQRQNVAEDSIVTTYTLLLEEDGNYTLTVAVGEENPSANTGTYVWDDTTKKLTLTSGSATDECTINSDGSITYDEVTLTKNNG